MLIREAIERAKYDIGVSTDDSTIGSRYVFKWLKSIRNELLRQEVEKKGIWSNMPMQTLRKFELELVDLAESREFESGEKGFKSIGKFPTLLDTKQGKILGGVFTPAGERIDVVAYTKSLNEQNRRYTSNKPWAVFRDGYLYLLRYPIITDTLFIDIDGIYENPEDIEALNEADGCDEDHCVFYPDMEFSVPGYLEARLFRMVRQELATRLGIPQDNTNNGKEDAAPPHLQPEQRN